MIEDKVLILRKKFPDLSEKDLADLLTALLKTSKPYLGAIEDRVQELSEKTKGNGQLQVNITFFEGKATTVVFTEMTKVKL